jgi:hypothetical protein
MLALSETLSTIHQVTKKRTRPNFLCQPFRAMYQLQGGVSRSSEMCLLQADWVDEVKRSTA